jgi:DNA-directed RNA polymerase subunit RPC12/RpoP
MYKKLNVLFFRRISLVFLFSSIIISSLSTFLNSIIGGIVGITLLIIYIIISIIFWRCPFCKKRLPMRFNINNVDEVLCPYCDANLLYGEEKK